MEGGLRDETFRCLNCNRPRSTVHCRRSGGLPSGQQPRLGRIGALVGSTIGDGRGQSLAIGAGGLLGGLIGGSLLPRRPAANRSNPVVRQMHDQRNQVIEAAVTGRTPMPRKARPILADKSLPRP